MCLCGVFLSYRLNPLHHARVGARPANLGRTREDFTETDVASLQSELKRWGEDGGGRGRQMMLWERKRRFLSAGSSAPTSSSSHVLGSNEDEPRRCFLLPAFVNSPAFFNLPTKMLPRSSPAQTEGCEEEEREAEVTGSAPFSLLPLLLGVASLQLGPRRPVGACARPSWDM